MLKLTSVAAALLSLCVLVQPAGAGVPPPPSLTLQYIGTTTSFAGGMTMVDTTLSTVIGSNDSGIFLVGTVVAPNFSGPAGFGGGATLGDLGCDNFGPSLNDLRCLFPLSFSAPGNVAGTITSTVTLANGFGQVQESASVSVPEPASLALLSIALLGFGIARRKAAR